nr:hypothetical protein [Armatimonas sp.]
MLFTIASILLNIPVFKDPVIGIPKPNIISKGKNSTPINLAAPYLSFLTEINTEDAGISNGGNSNPILEMTLTAYTALGRTTPKSGETVNFIIRDGLTGKVILSSDSGTTDSTGRCYVTIKSASGFPT